MFKIVGNILIIFLSCMATLLDARITMEIPASELEAGNQVLIGRPFKMEVIIDDVQGSVHTPTIKGFDGCLIQSTGVSSIGINGRTTARFSYNVRIDTLGTFSIGPAMVRHQQQDLVSNSLEVCVVKDFGIIAQKNKGNAAQPAKAFLRLMVDTETPCVGQKMSCSLRFYYQDLTMNLQSVNVPDLPGFDIKEISNAEKGKAEIDGIQYHYAQWRWEMYPTKAGEFLIPAYSADYEIPVKDNGHHLLAGFFILMGNRVEQKRVYSNAVTIKVMPLPHYDGPVHAVGSFDRFLADIKPGIAKEGEGMVLSLEIEGVGNLAAIETPKVIMPDSLKCYDSNSVIIPSKYQDDLPKKRFEFIVQGMKVGEYEIPSQLFTYFDTERNTYITLHTSPLSVSIMPGILSMKKDITDRSIADTIAQDNELADINLVGQWYPIAERKTLPWWLFKLLLLLPCLYVLYPMLQERFIILTGSSVRLARRRALKHARKKIEECIKNNNDTELHSIFMQLMRHYGEVIDSHSILKLLQQSNVSPELIEQWNSFFERITHAAYAQSDKKNSDELCEMAKQWLERLEKNI